MQRSIFEPRRFEYQGSHHYFIPPRLATALRTPLPIFLVGLRGTGKTTLLYSMSWKQRLSNPAYRDQLTEQHGDPFYDRVIGVYTKLPESKIEGIGVWLGALDELKGQLFSLYLDLLYVELLVDAVANLSVRDVIQNSASAERELVANLLEDVFYAPVWASLLKRHSCCTLKDLARLVNRGRRELEHTAETQSKFEDAQERFRPPQFGEFGKSVATSLGRYCNGQSADDTEETHDGWVFRVCMDEGENLSHDQQFVVNSMYRLSRWPLFFAIAYVEMPDVRSTFKRNLTLTDADRKTIALTTQTDSEFREYVEGVVNIRAKSEFGEQAKAFSVESLLGRMNLNRILDSVLKESVSAEAKDWQAIAKDLEADKDGYPPYLQCYFHSVAPKDETKQQDQRAWSIRRIESAGYRKKFVAAYLSLLNDLNIEVRYAFSDMLMQLSDKCVRDFLSQMNAIFEAASQGIAEFLQSTVDWRVQNRGIHAASQNKRSSFDSSLCVAGAEWLVDGLGYTTAHLQSRSARRLRSPELGRFIIRKKPDPIEEEGQLNEAILDAVMSGFLRTVDDEKVSGEAWVLQLHTSLAPHYGFSYRGAMYNCEVKRTELISFLFAPSTEEVKARAVAVSERIAGGSDDFPLFEGMGN